MKKRFLPMIIIILIVTSGIFLFFTGSITNYPISNQKKNENIKTSTLALGDSVNTINLTIQPLGLLYIDGYLWVCEKQGDLYKINAKTGAEILHHNIPFNPNALGYDGTYFYISVGDNPNGSIYKYTMDGVNVDKFDIPVSSFYVGGITYDGSNLWASKDETPNQMYKINPSTGDILSNFSLSYRYAGLMWLDNRLWAMDWVNAEAHVINPSTTKITEIIELDDTDFGKYGITNNGTHYFVSDWNENEIRIMEIPREAGEVWNYRASPDTHPLDIAYNGTHYFLTDSNVDKVDIIDAGTLRNVSSFYIPFQPSGIAVVGENLYISEDLGGTNIYKYSHSGTQITSFSTSHGYYALEYDGSKLWASDHAANYIRELSIDDCTEIKSYSVPVDYAGICYDSKNDVFWTLNWTTNKIIQLDTTFNQTGVEYDVPGPSGEFGIEFNGEHLVITSWGTTTIYKVIINLPVTQQIPGFTIYFLIMTMLSLFGIILLLKRNRISLI
ncbi:MAG: hypothetical protein EU548_02030 [Promethearchaeota archaeon]|nr:MAG: hypothetical protein EU548_02030 [Candidatus Lokiarchaeota archaeon]